MLNGSRTAFARMLRIPDRPPALPAEESARVERFRPHPGYLRYLLLQRWFAVSLAALGLIATGSLMQALGPGGFQPLVLIGLGGLTLLALGPALHVEAVIRYRLTWFALGSRSVRIRKGLWKITEATITYENVQNVKLQQGPLQRLLGISSLEIQTAGGGSRADPTAGRPALKAVLAVVQIAASFLPGGAAIGAHGGGGAKRDDNPPGRMDGLGNAEHVRDRVMRRVRRSRTAGLGDEAWAGAVLDARSRRRIITARHLAAMREIRDTLRGLHAGSGAGDNYYY